MESHERGAPQRSDDGQDVETETYEGALLKAVEDSLRSYLASDRNVGEGKQRLASTFEQFVEKLGLHGHVYVAKLTSEGRRNQFWQGSSLTQPYTIMVLVDQTNSGAQLAELAIGRLSPPPENGHSAFVVAKREGDDEWAIHAVAEHSSSDLAYRLRSIVDTPNFQEIRVPHPTLGARPLIGALGNDASSVENLPLADQLTPAEVILHLEEAKNVVLEGPPGTGKTHIALEVAKTLGGEWPQCATRLSSLLADRSITERSKQLLEAPLVWEFIQFHAAYAYDDFVRGLRAIPASGSFEFKPINGILPTMARVAALRAGKPTLLIIDEINRAPLTTVLGETIFAIDPSHRGESVRLQHSSGPEGDGDSLVVPENLYLLATMNTADRSISLNDFAVRRRFRFLPVQPAVSVIDDFYFGHNERTFATSELFRSLQDVVTEQELKPGHSYFLVDDHDAMTDAAWSARLAARILYEVRPLLLEYQEEGHPIGPWKVETKNGSIDLLKASTEDIRRAINELMRPGAHVRE